MRLIILLLIFPLSVFAQNILSKKSDTIYVGDSRYETYALQINNNSASDPARVFVTSMKNIGKLKQLVPKYYFARKQEFNEYYILGVPDMEQKENTRQGLAAFLNQIDSSRMKRKRSTFRRVYTWDNVNNKIIYQTTFRDLSQIDNLFYIKSVQDICKYMSCPYKHSVAN